MSKLEKLEDIKYAIICVDDDPNILHMLSFQIEKIVDHKQTILEYFTNPKDSVGHFDELVDLGIDVFLLIVDFHMPQMNGAQLIRQLKIKNKNLTCIMLSGQANSIQVTNLQNENLLHSFIHKPWSEDQLFDIIKPLLSQLSILCGK